MEEGDTEERESIVFYRDYRSKEDDSSRERK